jgi:hypothetical protein
VPLQNKNDRREACLNLSGEVARYLYRNLLVHAFADPMRTWGQIDTDGIIPVTKLGASHPISLAIAKPSISRSHTVTQGLVRRSMLVSVICPTRSCEHSNRLEFQCLPHALLGLMLQYRRLSDTPTSIGYVSQWPPRKDLQDVLQCTQYRLVSSSTIALSSLSSSVRILSISSFLSLSLATAALCNRSCSNWLSPLV